MCLLVDSVNEPPQPSPSPSVTSSPNPPIPDLSITPLQGDLASRFSRGERVMFTNDGDADRDAGVAAFSRGDYSLAIQSFNRSVSNLRNEPEAQIYLNNAMARDHGNPYVLAAVVPIENRGNVAKEMLRGIADAQTRFNEDNGYNGRLLEILIVNDGNNEAFAAQVAQELVAMPDILGVIGHNSSEASLAALPVYEQAEMPMISPTSTSLELKGNSFYRTVPSNQALGEKLASYVANRLRSQQAVIFYADGNYSTSLRDEFTVSFREYGGDVVNSINLSTTDFDPNAAIQDVSNQSRIAILLPSTEMIPRAISVATANAELPDPLILLGGDSLYDERTLVNGGRSVEGLILAVPWFANTAYAARAGSRWGGRVSWRTASSYDATQALLRALPDTSSPSEVLERLNAVELPPSETSGTLLKFTESGDRTEEPLLVKATRGGSRPVGTSLGFELAE